MLSACFHAKILLQFQPLSNVRMGLQRKCSFDHNLVLYPPSFLSFCSVFILTTKDRTKNLNEVADSSWMKNIKCNPFFSYLQLNNNRITHDNVCWSLHNLHMSGQMRCHRVLIADIAGAAGVEPPGAECCAARAWPGARGPHSADWGARHPPLPLPSPHTCPDTRLGLTYTCLPHTGHSGLTSRQGARILFWQPPHICPEEFSGEQCTAAVSSFSTPNQWTRQHHIWCVLFKLIQNIEHY